MTYVCLLLHAFGGRVRIKVRARMAFGVWLVSTRFVLLFSVVIVTLFATRILTLYKSVVIILPTFTDPTLGIDGRVNLF